jgi:hypothetical protein
MFENAQQFDLPRQRNIGQFVEKHRPTVGQGEQPRPGLGGPGEHSACVPEQLALDQVRLEGGQMLGQKRPITARVVTMDGSGDQFLAGAALAGDEHASVARGHQGDALEHHLHDRAAADDFFRASCFRFRGSQHDLRRWPAEQGTVDCFQRLAQIEWFCQVIEGSALNRLDRRWQVAERRHDNHRQVGREGAQPRQRRQSIHARQTDIEDHDSGSLAGEEREGLFRGGRHRNGVALAAQGALQRPEHRFLIIHNQNVFHHPLSAIDRK